MSMAAVAHVPRVAVIGRCGVFVGARGMRPHRLGSLSAERGLGVSLFVHVRDRRFDPEEGEEENHWAGHEPPESQGPHCTYVNPMTHTFKPYAARITILILALSVWACGGQDRAHSGEPVVRFRFGVDTTAPDTTLLPAMMSLGNTVFQSSCGACHAPGNAERGASDLARSQWLIGASYGEVVHFLAVSGPHRPGERLGTVHGGASQLSLQELRAVALFVDSLAGTHAAPAAKIRR